VGGEADPPVHAAPGLAIGLLLGGARAAPALVGGVVQVGVVAAVSGHGVSPASLGPGAAGGHRAVSPAGSMGGAHSESHVGHRPLPGARPVPEPQPSQNQGLAPEPRVRGAARGLHCAAGRCSPGAAPAGASARTRRGAGERYRRAPRARDAARESSALVARDRRRGRRIPGRAPHRRGPAPSGLRGTLGAGRRGAGAALRSTAPLEGAPARRPRARPDPSQQARGLREARAGSAPRRARDGARSRRPTRDPGRRRGALLRRAGDRDRRGRAPAARGAAARGAVHAAHAGRCAGAARRARALAARRGGGRRLHRRRGGRDLPPAWAGGDARRAACDADGASARARDRRGVRRRPPR